MRRFGDIYGVDSGLVQDPSIPDSSRFGEDAGVPLLTLPDVSGESDQSDGVRGTSHSQSAAGVAGYNDRTGPGVYGKGSTGGFFEGTFEGVHVVGHHPLAAGVAGYNVSTGPGVYGKSIGGAAGFFEGNIVVTGHVTTYDVRCSGGDCAEEFDVVATAEVEPGTVVVLDQEGALRPSQQAYDKRVAGVISGAGDYKPGIVLDRQQSSGHRAPVALVGKVYCKVDAHYGSVEVGDLLTTSDTPGYAMKADDPHKAFGAVIGKALRPLKEGQNLVPILIALQ